MTDTAKAASTEIVETDFSPEAILAAGVDMSITKADLIDMIIVTQSENIQAAITEQEKNVAEFRGVENTSENSHHNVGFVTRGNGIMVMESYGHHDDIDPAAKALLETWFLASYPTHVALMRKWSKKIFVRWNNIEHSFSFSTFNYGTKKDRKVNGHHDMTLVVADDQCKEYATYCKELSGMQSELYDLRRDLRDVESSDRKVKVMLMQRLLEGTAQGKKTLNILGAMSGHSRYKQPQSLLNVLSPTSKAAKVAKKKAPKRKKK